MARPGLRALTFGHIRQRDDRWCIVDLVGKHARVRTVPMPTWVKATIESWTGAASLTNGRIFRPVIRRDRVRAIEGSRKV